MKNSAELLTAESTQTVRALTRAELDGSNQSKWYVVQLVISDRPINLEVMPRLEIVAEHRLYTVVGRQGGRQLHALRLGFFSDVGRAQMMCKHVQTFFAAPTVVRVSMAEQERFAHKSGAKHESVATSAPKVVALPAATATGGSFLPPEIALKTGAFRAMSPQPRSAGDSQAQGTKSSASTPARAGIKKSKSLAEELIEEARQVRLSRSGKHRVVQPPHTWLSRLFGRPKR